MASASAFEHFFEAHLPWEAVGPGNDCDSEDEDELCIARCQALFDPRNLENSECKSECSSDDGADNSEHAIESDNEASSENLDLFERAVVAFQNGVQFLEKKADNVWLVRLPDATLKCLKLQKRKTQFSRRDHKTQLAPLDLRIASMLKRACHQRPRDYFLQDIEWFYLSDTFYATLSEFTSPLDILDICTRPGDVASLLFQLLSGIFYMHQAGVVHRDIKPSNLLWDTEAKRLTIIDYDVSTWITPIGHCAYAGTFGAPEMYQSLRDAPMQRYNESCDIYAAGVTFGCILYRVSEADFEEPLVTCMRKQAELLPRCTADLLKQMIQVDAKLRPSAADLLRHPFFERTLGDYTRPTLHQIPTFAKNPSVENYP